MDGVITDTASIHAACWKSMFDEYLQTWAKKTGQPFRPFDVATDYKLYIDESRVTSGFVIFFNRAGSPCLKELRTICRPTEQSVAYAAEALGIGAESCWPDTGTLDHVSAEARLTECDAIWCGTSSTLVRLL
jgi:beta-phosphoglucomutase-like phosphatase (HAD superfamily)